MSGNVQAATSGDLAAVVQLSEASVEEGISYGQIVPGYDWFAERLAHG